MFGNNKNKLKDSERSLISETVSIEGTINSSGAIDIAGLVKGPVYSKEIIIRETGSITGSIDLEEGQIETDICFYVAVLHTIGLEALAVTTNCSINFLRKPDPKILYGRARIFKKGKSLIVGDVEILGEDRKIIVAHASMTYSCPPTKI